jgi:hypothetical protein
MTLQTMGGIVAAVGGNILQNDSVVYFYLLTHCNGICFMMIENNCLFLVFEVLNSVCQRATFISQGPS